MNTQTEKMINDESHTRNSIIEKHGRLVHAQCHKLKIFAKSVGQEYEDIVSEGFIGLIKAYDRFDGDKYDVRFSTYAVPYIYGTIQQFLNKQNVGFKYPREVKVLGWKIARLSMTDDNIEVIARELGESTLSVDRALNYLRNSNPVRLNSFVNSDESGADLNEIIGAEDDFTEIHATEYLQGLNEREKIIAEELYKGSTQAEIGLLIGTTQAQVSRVIRRMRLKYKEYEKEAI